MIFLPPDRQQPAAESKKEERGDFEKRAAGDAMFSQPKNQEQGSRQCASGRLGEQCERKTSKRGGVETPPPLIARGKIDIFNPRQQCEQEKESHQDIFQFRNPGDRFDLDRVEREDRRGQERARHFEADKNSPEQQRVRGVKENVHPMVAGRVQIPEGAFGSQHRITQRKILGWRVERKPDPL